MNVIQGKASVHSSIEPAATAWPRLREEWAKLHAALPHPTFFLSEGWTDSWLATFASEKSCDFWTLRSGRELIGAAILVRRTERRGPIPVRCLYLNTAGEGDDSVTVEHNTVLTCRGHEAVVWRELGESLRRLAWDELILNGGDTAAAERLRALYSEWQTRVSQLPSPYVLLKKVCAQPEGMIGLLSSNSRSQLRRAARNADAQLVLDEPRDEESRLETWTELHRLHTRRWETAGLPGAFSRPRWLAFHERIRTTSPKNTRLFRLRSGEATVAAAYLLQFDSHVAFYQSGVEQTPEVRRLKPGLLMHLMIIDRLASEGLTEYDYLASDELGVRYKRSLATDERSLWWITVLRPTFRNRAVTWLRGARQWLGQRR